MRDTFFASALTLILPALILSAQAAPAKKPAPTAVSDTQTVSGGCKQNSTTTYGGLKAAPGDQHSHFACDTAVVTFLDAKRQHVTLTFSQSGKKDGPTVGLDGMMDKDGVTAKIKQMSLAGVAMNPADDGSCKLAFAGRAITAAQCSASMHQDKNRWSAVVDFKVIPPQ